MELPDSAENVAVPIFIVETIRVELTVSELVVIALPDSAE